jgi:AAHS family cis,cis-muconate transporter-like MFS transporter
MEHEWRFHLEARVDALVARGLPPGAARQQARREFGDMLRRREASRDAGGARFLLPRQLLRLEGTGDLVRRHRGDDRRRPADAGRGVEDDHVSVRRLGTQPVVGRLYSTAELGPPAATGEVVISHPPRRRQSSGRLRRRMRSSTPSSWKGGDVRGSRNASVLRRPRISLDSRPPFGYDKRLMTARTPDSLDRTGKIVAIGVFVALVVDGMDLQMLALALPSLTKELHMSSVMAGALSTYTLLGMGIGGILAGWLSDRIGRVRVTWWAVFTFTICTGIIALCRGYWEIAVMRFVSGFGIAALYSIGTLLAAEYVPTRIRTTVLGALQAGWSVGYVIAALSSAYILPRFGWRPLFLCAIVPGAISLLMLRGLPDPPSWSASRRSKSPRGAEPGAFAVLLRDPVTRRGFVLWTLTSIALQFGYYGANTWLPSYLVRDLGVNLQNMGWYVAGTYTMMVLGKVITGYLADIFGRRAMWIASGMLTAIYLPVLIYAATPANVAYLLLVFGLLYGAPYAVNSTYMSETFPAVVRGTAVGTSYNLGRIGSTLSPLLIGMAASRYSIGVGIGLLGISYAICALIPGAFIREKMFDPNAVEEPAARAPQTVPANAS